MKFSYSQTENFETEKLSSDTALDISKNQWRSTGGVCSLIRHSLLELKKVNGNNF